MATVILTAVGTAIGGPIGGAVGALIGQSVDRALFSAKRQGPRLTELSIQTSSYGTAIPKLFGTMRVAGTVIWATDLTETRGTSGGKGQRTTTYAYSASFAVALSARPVAAVRRIWADGKLLRGAGGDWKARTGFRLHTGGEDQAVDPLIASAEGIALTPAHRGIAYAVFEGLELADFGNRIPSLTFELVADEGAVACGAVARALADEVTAADDGLALGGFAASGSARGVLEVLAAASGGWFAAEEDGLALRTGGAAARTVADAGYGGARGVRTLAGAASVPGSVGVSHYDAARDYQAGLQRARMPGGASREERVEVPAVLGAGEAKALAEAILARAGAERVRRTVHAGLDALSVRPGEIVAIAGETGTWRVMRTALEGMAVSLELVPVVPGGPVTASASGGRVLAEIDAVAGATLLHAFEVPALDDGVLTAPRLLVAAAGTGAGWRRADLLVSTDAGASWDEAGSTAGAAVIGLVEVPPPPGSAVLTDRAGALTVRLAQAGMFLAEADDAGLDRGANLALVGDELLQFGAAEPLGDRRWRLSRLLRGRRGTEWAIGGQGAGDRFVMLDGATIRSLALPAGTQAVRVLASGVGDGTAVTATAPIDGSSLRPPAVAQLRWTPAAAGFARVEWVRRSRAGWRWSDGADVPLCEEAERYRVTVTDAAGLETVEQTAAERTVARPATVTVRQRGTWGDSRAATIVVPA